jgi:tellurite resistance protein TerC
MNVSELLFFGLFLFFIMAILMIDLGIFNKKSHIVRFKESLSWTIVWVGLALAFYALVLIKGQFIHGISNLDDLKDVVEKFKHPIEIDGLGYNEALQLYKNNLGLEYITGYLIEYALSIDNVFVMIMIFMAFGIEKQYYHRILFWGIFGAVVMRFLFIFVASAMIQEFAWTLYFFGALLVYTGGKMFIERNKEDKIDTANHPVVKYVSKYFSVYANYKGQRFTIKKDGKKFITPLLIVLLVIEFTDVIFSVDSVPAIFSITKDPYIVFFSNIFAIIGLRSLFFFIMNAMSSFHYLKVGLAVLLTFIGIKLLVHHWLEEIGFETAHSLYIVLGILGASVIASLLFPKKEKA